MAKSGIGHADVGDELSKTEWLSEESHQLVHGTSFPDSPAERQLFYRDDQHKWYVYSGSAWVDLTAGGGAPPAHASTHEDGGSDEISVAGLAGEPAELTTHKANASAHHSNVVTITFVIDGGGSAITTGQKGHLEIPFACTITRVTLLADQSGSIVIDIWKDTYANFPPTDADSITASAPPTISSAQKSQDSTLTGWTTAIAAGDILAFNVDSCSTITRVTISLKVGKS
jgi:hypothetical protein